MITLNAINFDIPLISIIGFCLIVIVYIIARTNYNIKYLDYMKSCQKEENGDNKNESKNDPAIVDQQKIELQKQDRAKALVKDFYEASSKIDKDKSLESTKTLLELYVMILNKERQKGKKDEQE